MPPRIVNDGIRYGGQLQASAVLTQREIILVIQWIEGWVGPTADLDAFIKCSSSHRKSNPDSLVVQPVG
jgi:hypothetical protein